MSFCELIRLHTTVIPDFIFDMDLDLYEFKTYAYFKMLSDRGEICEKSNKEICKEIRFGLAKFSNVKKSLVNKGLIQVTVRYDNMQGRLTDLIQICEVN